MKDYVLPLLSLLFLSVFADQPPNIVFIVADDLGWNDVGFRNPFVISPEIDKLARMGVILNHTYVQPLCTPSRTAFMTGMFPYKVGMQHLVILPQEPACSALDKETLAQKLKKNGYATHIIGKWHLGMCKWECTPTYRGFDTFYGFYNGKEDYYDATLGPGVDFRDNKIPIKKSNYSTFAYASRADQILRTHNKSQPLFLYYPFQSVHSPIQVPKQYEDLYPAVKNQGRRQYLGMVTAMDDAIGSLVESLQQNGMMNNTLIVFTSDNGGTPTGYGNNYPLRGAKTTVYEGGTRASAFVYGKGIQKTGITYDGLMHAVDFMPTILSAAGIQSNDDIDGIDMWDSIRTGSQSNRTSFVYNFDDLAGKAVNVSGGQAAIRVGDYKLIEGYPGQFPDWYTPPENETDIAVKECCTAPETPQLFNLKDDPYEHNNLYKKEPKIYQMMKARLEQYKKDMVPADFPPNDPNVLPKDYGGFWSPGWC